MNGLWFFLVPRDRRPEGKRNRWRKDLWRKAKMNCPPHAVPTKPERLAHISEFQNPRSIAVLIADYFAHVAPCERCDSPSGNSIDFWKLECPETKTADAAFPNKRKATRQVEFAMNTYKPDRSAQPRIGAERFWHALAVQHAQRLEIIRLLASIDRKLERLVEELL